MTHNTSGIVRHRLRQWFQGYQRVSGHKHEKNFYAEAVGAPIFHNMSYGRNDLFNFAQKAYKTNAVVNRCVNFISSNIAGVNIYVYDRDVCLGEEHPFVRLLARPNHMQERKFFTTAVMTHLMLFGECFIHLTGDLAKGLPLEMHVIPPHHVNIVMDSKGFPVAYEYAGKHYPCFPHKTFPFLHLKFYNPATPHYGQSILESIRPQIELYHAINRCQQEVMENCTFSKGVISSSTPLKPEQREALQEALEKFRKERGATLILSNNLKWDQLTDKNIELDFTKTKKLIEEEIALVFNTPAHLWENQAYANYDGASYIVWVNTLLPILGNYISLLDQLAKIHLGHHARVTYHKHEIPQMAEYSTRILKTVNELNFLSLEQKQSFLNTHPL